MIEEPIDPTPIYTGRLAFDIVGAMGSDHEGVPALISALGMTPPGPDGFGLEHTQSHLRAQLVAPHEAKIEWLAKIAARIWVCLMLEQPGDDTEELEEIEDDESDDDPENDREELEAQYAEAIHAATVAIMSNVIFDALMQGGTTT